MLRREKGAAALGGKDPVNLAHGDVQGFRYNYYVSHYLSIPCSRRTLLESRVLLFVWLVRQSYFGLNRIIYDSHTADGCISLLLTYIYRVYSFGRQRQR